MPTWHYQASDAQGRKTHGKINADSARHARQSLRARGLLPLALREAGGHKGAGQMRLGARLSDAELGWMTRQIASLLMAHLPLEAALAATLDQAERRHTQHVLASLLADVRAGHRLGQALAAHARDFPEVYRALVDAGEQAGDIAQVMMRLASYIEARGHLRNKVLNAFIYPAIVTAVSIAIVIFMLSYVVPQVVGAFSRNAQTLPLLTRAMLAGSDAIREWGAVACAGFAGAFALWRWRLRVSAARLAWHARVLRLPLFGRYALGVDAARFAATLAILAEAGVPLLAALEAAQRTLHNAKLRAAAGDVVVRVREGGSLARALADQRVFPPLLVHMVASGEQAGDLPGMLQHAARTLSADLERRAMTLTALLEPVMILLMGGVVLLIVLAIMLPIIEINQLVM